MENYDVMINEDVSADNLHMSLKELYDENKKLNNSLINLNQEINDLKEIKTLLKNLIPPKSKFKFKFSIIMAVYNVELYLKEAIDSIIYQNIGFKDNVQLILVDDGSTDNSRQIALDYQEDFPENIIVLSQENSGQASARNLGLKYAQGKYVNFLDSDDYLSKNTLKSVYTFFENHFDEIDIVAIPMKLFERVTVSHRLNNKFHSTRVLNLNKEPNSPLLSSSSAFIKYDAIKDYQFDTNLVNLEDALIINKILLEKFKYGVVNNCNYFYRQRNIRNSTVDSASKKKEFFTDRLKHFYIHLIDYCLENHWEVPLFIQYLMAYDLQWLLKTPDLSVFDNDEEIIEFWKCLNHVLYYIDVNVVYGNKNILSDIRPFFLYLLGENFSMELNNEGFIKKVGRYIIDKLNNHKIWLDIIEINGDSLNISGTFVSYFNNKNLSIDIIKEKNGFSEKYSSRQVQYNTFERSNHSFLGIDWKFCYNFDVSIPLIKNENSDLKFMVSYHNYEGTFSYESLIGLNNSVNLSKFSACISKKPYIILFKDFKLFIKKYSYLKMLRYEYSNIKKVRKDKPSGGKHSIKVKLLYLALYPFMNKHIWLYLDRPDFADDNAKHLFKYATSKKSNVKNYFIVEQNSDSFEELKKINKNVIPFGSLKHQLLYLFAEKIISSYVNENFLNPFFDCNKKLYNGLFTSTRVFLQHGVTKDNISQFIKKYNQNLSLIVTVSDLEKESFLSDGYNYDESVIQVLGFPRYDNLVDEDNKKQILFMPTWRLNISDADSFLNSDYYNSLNSVLNNPDLILKLKIDGYNLVFKPHAELMKYMDLLDIHDEVIISENDSYQDLFKYSSLLITDYSSVFFDFAYLKKPIIYYQPNDDYHYDGGYFDYEKMGFGEVIINEKDLLNKVLFYLSNDFNMEDEFKNNVDLFFKFNDQQNCKRVYDWISEH